MVPRRSGSVVGLYFGAVRTPPVHVSIGGTRHGKMLGNVMATPPSSTPTPAAKPGTRSWSKSLRDDCRNVLKRRAVSELWLMLLALVHSFLYATARLLSA